VLEVFMVNSGYGFNEFLVVIVTGFLFSDLASKTH
jgi:hypothetical protein